MEHKSRTILESEVNNISSLPLSHNQDFLDSQTIPRLIVGLGNPGRQYDGTRHNIGFTLIDSLASSHGLSFSFESKFNAEITKIPASSTSKKEILLMKPMTFMNLSGTAVGACTRFLRIEPHQILVVLDDVSLPLGKLRFKTGGSSGGQRGLDSILAHCSTQEVPRLRFGIGPLEDESPPLKPLAEFVLERFSSEELPQVETSLRRAIEALEYLRENGLNQTMNCYNS